MKNKIINAKIFRAKVTNKTNWLFLKLENEIGIVGWGEATLQGKEKQVFEISEQIFDLILNLHMKYNYHVTPYFPLNLYIPYKLKLNPYRF